MSDHRQRASPRSPGPPEGRIELERDSDAPLPEIDEAFGITGHRVAPPNLPLFESGRADLAENADVLLRGFGEP
jgi:hypothetical protein